MKKKLHISTHYSDKLMTVLIDWGGKYETINYPMDEWYVYFDIYEDDDYYPIVSECVSANAIVIISKVYTQKEMDSAEWLTVRAKTQTLDCRDVVDVCTCSCIIDENRSWHRVKSENPIYMSKIKWTTRKHFNSSYELSMDHLFCDELAKKILSQNVKGMSFEDVFHWRTKEVLNNVYKIRFVEKIKREDIILDDYEGNIITCPCCGLKTYSVGGEFSLIVRKDSIPAGLNAFCTEEIFGSALLTPMNIISQEVYQILRENKIDRGLCFEPVILV